MDEARRAEVKTDIAAAIADCKRELGADQTAANQRVLGRWALDSGTTFEVLRVDFVDRQALAVCRSLAKRWHVPVDDLVRLLDRGGVRYLGRVR